MKFLVVLFLAIFACSSSVPIYSYENELQTRAVDDFLSDLTLAAEENLSLDEVKKKLRERLDEVLRKIKDAIDQGKSIKEDVTEKVKEIRQKLKDLHVDLGGKGEELLKEIREKGREYLQKILERLGLSKRDTSYHAEEILRAEDESDIIAQLKNKWVDIVKKVKDAFENGKSIKDGLEKLEQIRNKLKEYNINLEDFSGDFLNQLKEKVKDYWNKLKDKLTSKRNADIDVFGMFERLKEIIKEKFDPERLREVVEKYFGKGSELAQQFINLLKEKGEKRKQKILDWIARVLGDKEDEKMAASNKTSNIAEEFKEFFKDLKIDFKDRFSKFGEWIKDQYKERLEKGKTRDENIRKIAKEFLNKTTDIGKDMAKEALEFFKQYKNGLGKLWDNIFEKSKQIMKEAEN